jgi:hypothetical protein
MRLLLEPEPVADLDVLEANAVAAHAAGLDGLLIEDDGSEKVAVTDMGSRISDVALGRIGNVFPEDTPIFGLIPDVGPLVDGDDELDAPVEEVKDGLCGGLLHSLEE